MRASYDYARIHYANCRKRDRSTNMPTLLIYKGFKFFFYANEHEPKHIHVMKGGDFAKIELATLKVTDNYMEPKDIKKALTIVENHNTEFERRWDEYFDKR